MIGVSAQSEPRFSRPLAVLVAGAYFMEILDATIIAPAAPAMARDLGITPVQVNVVMTAYLVTVAVLIPGSGWLADRFGIRPVFLAALVIFTLASAGCAAATTLDALVAARVAQGVGGALMVPVGRLAVLRLTPKPALMTAIAYLTWPALLAPVLAPTLGGVLSTYASWRWIFLVNLPLGIVAVLVGLRLVPAGGPAPTRVLDWPGLLLVAATVAALMVGLELLGAPGAMSSGLAALILAAIIGSFTVRHLRRTAQPLLDLGILRTRTLRVTVTGGGVYRMVVYAVPFLVPLYLIVGFGWTGAGAGVVMIALFAGNIGMKPLTTPIMRRIGLRAAVLVAVVMGAACLGALALLPAPLPLPLLVAVLFLSGVFRSLGFSAYNTLAFSDVPPAVMSQANTVNAALTELAGGLGIAVGALLLRAGAAAAHLVEDPVPPQAGYRIAFVVLAVLLVLPLLEMARMPGSAGGAVTGRT